MGRRLLPKRETLILTRNSEEKDRRGYYFFMMFSLSWAGIRLKIRIFILSVESKFFQAFEPYLDEVIVTHIHARVEGDTYFPEELICLFLKLVSSKFLRQR